MSLLEKVYLPDLEQRNIRNSDAYKTLKENNLDTSILEGYESQSKFTPIEFKELDTFQDKEEWIAKHAGPEQQKEFFSNLGDFLLETGKDGILSLGVAAINGADVAANLMPLFAKVLDNSPITGVPGGFMNAETEKQVYDSARYVSENLGKARDYLKSFKEDDNVVSQLIGVMGQDLVYSIPIYNKLRDLGVSKYPAFFISGGIGGAIGVEDKVLGNESTFSQSYLAKDIIELKNLIGILPNTPEDKIADEVVQALEYGGFSVAIPGIIDAFKFMKRYIPAFSTAGVGTVAMTAGNEAEGSPIKAIVNAVDNVPVFKSAVKEVAEQKITKGSAEQIYNTIKNTPGVKEAELKWLDLEEQLKGYSQITKKPLTKENVLELIRGNQIEIEEVMFGGGRGAKLSDDLEQKIIKFENRYLDSFEDPEYPNYDVYRFTNQRNDAIENVLREPEKDKLDFNGVSEILDAEGIIKDAKYFSRDYINEATGKIEIHRMVDALQGNKFIAPKSLADKLIKDKEKLRKVPGILKAPGELRYRRFNIYEFDPIEVEKYFLEKEKRAFVGKHKAPKFYEYTEPGGDDYTELVFKVKRGGMDIGIPTTKNDQRIKYTPYRNRRHMDVKSEIAHVRFKTRITDDNKRILAVEEMQSDFGIAVTKSKKSDLREIDEASGFRLGEMAREEFGFNEGTLLETQDKLKKAISERKIDFPFKNNWYELTIKRLARYAADNGFDGIAIPKGNLAANRYGEQIDKITKIEVKPSVSSVTNEPIFRATFFDDKNKFVKAKAYDEKEIYDLEKEIGSKNYAQLKENIDNFLKKRPENDLRNTYYNAEFEKPIIVGSGKGKFRLYNETIPSYMKKYGKKWNAKIYDDQFVVDDLNVDSEIHFERMKKIPVTILELSPEMKKDVVSSSQPLFEIFGTVGLSTWIADEVSDSMQNNIISTSTEKMY